MTDKNKQHQQEKKWVKWLKQNWPYLLVGCLIAAFMLLVKPLKLKEDILPKIWSLLGGVVVVTIVVERAMEVLLTPLRAPKSEKIGQEIKKLEEEIELKPIATRGVNHVWGDLIEKRDERLDHKSFTRKLSFAISIPIGISISTLGFRILAPLVLPESLGNLQGISKVSFHGLDIILSGLLIAGGSDWIHRLMNLVKGMGISNNKKKKPQK
jgi:hypothetical protein